jgi:hypothetical protein
MMTKSVGCMCETLWSLHSKHCMRASIMNAVHPTKCIVLHKVTEIGVEGCYTCQVALLQPPQACIEEVCLEWSAVLWNYYCNATEYAAQRNTRL